MRHTLPTALVLSTVFAASSQDRHPDPAGIRHYLERLQLVWSEEGARPQSRVLLDFSAEHIRDLDLITELQAAIAADIEEMNDERDRDIETMHAHFQDRISGETLAVKSVYMQDDVTAVDTLYRLTLPSGRRLALFVMPGTLAHDVSDQIEISVRRALRPNGTTHLPLSLRAV